MGQESVVSGKPGLILTMESTCEYPNLKIGIKVPNLQGYSKA
jgi:hypothetical protein